MLGAILSSLSYGPGAIQAIDDVFGSLTLLPTGEVTAPGSGVYWLLPVALAGRWGVMVSLTDGSASGDDFDTWLPLTSTRSWTTDFLATLHLKFRDATSGAVLSEQDVTIFT